MKISAIKFQFLFLALSLTMLQACSSPAVIGNPSGAVEDYVQLGLNYLSNGNRDQARFNLVRALEIAPNSIEANNAIALLYESESEFALAEKHYKNAIKRDKTFTQARNNYARFLYRQDRYKEARKQYQLVSEDVNYRLRPQGFIGLALSEKSLGNSQAAEAALARSYSLNPGNGSAILELAQLELDRGDYLSSKEYLDRFDDLGQPSPRSLSIGLQLADKFGLESTRESYSMALKNMYPDSREARTLILSEQSGAK